MSALTDDVLEPRLLGSTRTVPELLAALGVADAGMTRQREAVRRAVELHGVAPLLAHLRPELERRRLL